MSVPRIRWKKDSIQVKLMLIKEHKRKLDSVDKPKHMKI